MKTIINNLVKIQTLLLLLLLCLTSNVLFACDDSSAALVSTTANGGDSYTYEFDVCIEYNGLEGSPDGFLFDFSPGTVDVQAGFSPASVFTSDGSEYAGSITNGGSTLGYSFGGFLATHSGTTNCFTATITVQGTPTSVTVVTHEGNSAASCNIQINFPPPPSTPCDCGSGNSCDGSTFADQSAAVNALNGVTTSSGACFDLSSFTLPADDGEVYEFCYEYTHSSAATEFAFSSVVALTDVGNCLNNSSLTRSVYQLGNCGSAISSSTQTSDGWNTYPATNGTTYLLCSTIDADETECCGDLMSVCTFAHPTDIICDIVAVDAPSIQICQGIATSLSAEFTGTAAGTVNYTWTANPSGALGLLSSTTVSNPTVDTNTPGVATFTVQMTDDNCTVTDAVTVTVLPSSDATCTTPCSGPAAFINE